ncbi:membrane protein insertase YidC [Thermosulfurimonas sp. F29]|uniref:membrane protein insertase YidC n=1 Tax=Thermosulfurimonas sp. F29 TaxID=2867247 RepID=UPI001C82BE43|nr:membrane protein insertase YidC [Thermosulfurimonas sp. F29]MBX6422311.1 membrane protein insertase YidC [Thermosulfurimonas sp. F29]
METRALLAIVISVFILMVFNWWYAAHYAPPPEKRPVAAKASRKSPSGPAPPEVKRGRKPSPPLPAKLARVRDITVDTDLFRAVITEAGARFKSFVLKDYRQDLSPDSPPVELVSAPKEGLPVEVYLAGHPELAIYPYQGPGRTNWRLSGPERAGLDFQPAYEFPVRIEKSLTFRGRDYLFDLTVRVVNHGKKPVRDRLILRLVEAPFTRSNRYIFKGPAFYDGKRLEEVKLKKGLREYQGALSWVAYEDAYFLTAILPAEDLRWRVTMRRLSGERHEILLWSPEFSLEPGRSRTFRFALYFGPKKTENLKAAGHNLAAALHFGFFDPVAKPLLWALKFFHRFVGNYGLAIILLTMLIRILFWPLNHLSYKSMKRMQEIQPLIQRLREKYKDDPQALNRELMQVYRTYKINPFSGCLPMLIQIPVFFALYKVLLQAIELRHAPFFAWINDLSAPDRLYLGFHIPYLHGIPVLTLLMGVSMYVQQRLSPTSLDPTQARLMLIMPVFFTVLFVNFPSGLVLYWLVNNLLSIVQQLITNKLQAR